MSGPVVNIRNRCNRRCKCKGGRQLTTLVRIIKEIPEFGYCTHEANGTSKISNATWKGVELDRVGGGLHPFEDSASITVYYHFVLDGKQASINKPLLIRSIDSRKQTHWFENVGHYANKKWKRIDKEAEFEKYPTEDNYAQVGKFEEKLKAIACRLFASHGIYISHDKEYALSCPICNRPVNVIVKNYNSELLGYTKYEYSGDISDKSILVYKENQITYRRQNKGFPGYYLPIQLEEENVDKVSVYYWREDKQQENPLLLRIELDSGISYWLENISKGEKDGSYKHEKWNPIEYAVSKTFSTDTNGLKKRLDALNCIYNKVVQINVGKSDCHNTKHYVHKDRIYYSYGEEFGTFPVLYSYKYLHTAGTRESLNISEISVDGQQQKFENGLPFKDITRLTIYVSPCSLNIPFLICVKYNNNTRYEWYERTDTNGNWKKHTKLDKQAPKKDKSDILSVFNALMNNLGIKDCNVQTTASGIKLDITKTVKEGKFSDTYNDTSGGRKVPIFLAKSREEIVLGFFKNFHRPATNGKTFVANRELQLGGEIGRGTGGKIQGIEDFHVYFWDGEPTNPILIGIKQQNRDRPRYYGKFAQTWMNGPIDTLDEQQALDHQNCMVNNAIPIDLKNPTSSGLFRSGKRQSSCLKDVFITQIQRSTILPKGANDYNTDAYQLSNNKRISRVTYDNEPTNIVPPYDEKEPTLNIYYWNKDFEKVPLLIEFKPTNGKPSTWYENLGKEKYKKWENIHENVHKMFYSQDDQNYPQLIEGFTVKLNEVNCVVNRVVQLDISQKSGKYCHSVHSGHSKRVKVSKEQDEKYKGFIGYVHESAVTSQDTFSVSSITNSADLQSSDVHFPLNVSRVTVYFPECNQHAPVMMYIQESGGMEKWLKRTKDNNRWENATTEFNNKNGDTNKIKRFLETIRDTTNACNTPPPNPHVSYSLRLPTSLPAPVKDMDDKLSLNNIFDGIKDIDIEEFMLTQDEYEDDEVIEEQVKHTLVTISPLSIPVVALPGPIGVAATQITSPSITIDISQKPPGNGAELTYTLKGSTGKVYLEKGEYPYDSGFDMFTHEALAGQPFTVEKVMFGKEGEIGDLRPENEKPITSYSVWYWKEDNGMSKPLLVETANEYGTYTYRHSKDWKSWNAPHHKYDPLEGEKLETELDDLNCQLNYGVTMDISYEKYKEGNYCCKNHSNKKVTVKNNSISSNGSKHIQYHTHSISNDGDKLAKIKYYLHVDVNKLNKERKRVITKGLDFPIDSPVNVYVFYCNQNPALIYIKKNGRNGADKWYKRKDKNDHISRWEEVSGQLNDITSTDLVNLDCQKQRKLVDVLKTVGCLNLEECSGAPTVSGPQSTSVNVVSAPQDPEVTIKFSQKTLSPYLNNNKVIKITGSPYPGDGSDFLKYEYVLLPKEKFTLVKIEDESGNNLLKRTTTKEVISVSGYYWNGKLGKALLVGVATKDGKTKYYRNSKGNTWESYPKIESDKEPTKEELDFLNCEINDVVQIDVSKTSDYCHNGHKDGYKKISVKEVNYSDRLGNYTAYEHSPTSGRLNISGFKNGQDSIKLDILPVPIKDAEKVVVYFCKANLGDPLLIYVPDSKNAKRWFKKSDPGENCTKWEFTYGLHDKRDTDHISILNFLDTLESRCKPPLVTVDIYQRGYPNYRNFIYEDTNVQPDKHNILVIPNSNPPGVQGFTGYKHTVEYRYTYFTVNGFKYNLTGATNFGLLPTNYVTCVYVFYYTPLDRQPRKGDNRGRPLLIKIVTIEPTSKTRKEEYYENKSLDYDKNDKWGKWSPTLNPVDSGVLQRKLHLLNCKLNNAVVIDVSKQVNYDACEKNTLDDNHGERMEVKKEDHNASLGNYSIYTHKLKDGLSGKFHVTDFFNGGQNSLHVGGTPDIPILDVSEVKVYRCDKDGKSLLTSLISLP
ncbi:hypothetical protein BEWA_047630 [Theileria equi strain WA]|uniref:Uncharacterized protein n=1 Tax=Theileria equi strain WA TaxID=1537102 RepID=L1LAY7_THEEQ|nr:hypothetical protein BEWA_047630 [Theileria equi strain WA]EKX72298.1 hypothetical protein BEWA_047630 [Theileria equi strain WA]|eukprot:XP_004831750.1 hypothetical protein BEWA_047630 [Theileria equi strain WA]